MDFLLIVRHMQRRMPFLSITHVHKPDMCRPLYSLVTALLDRGGVPDYLLG
jgi:hypothetical protein